MRRPLEGEPPPIDLVNTEWRDASGAHDGLATRSAAKAWLRQALPAEASALTEGSYRALLALRAALRDHARRPDDPAACAALAAFLERGRLRVLLTPKGPDERAEVDDPDDRVAFLLAWHYINVLRSAPGRVRACANPACLLAFVDGSKNGRRQWCSMRACGNVDKARRFQQRAKAKGAK